MTSPLKWCKKAKPKQMFKQNSSKTSTIRRTQRLVNTSLLLFGLTLASLTLGLNLPTTNYQLPGSDTAYAAESTYLNFQARLRSSTGSIVPDGNYNIEFKIYDANSSSGSSQGSCTGDSNCLWTETRTGGNVVRVANGYMSVSLGSVNAFPSTIDWSEELFLTMNIGGTGSPSWDGEMTNSGDRLQLTAIPYAFKAKVAGNVASGNTNSASTNSGNVSITTGSATGSTSNSGNILIDNGTATGTAGSISLGASNSSGLVLARSGVQTSINGSLAVAQAATFNGNITLGDATSDTITFTGRVNSDILPSVDDTYSLGSSTFRWQDLYLGPGSLYIGTDSDEGVLSYNTTLDQFEFDQTVSIAGDIYATGELRVGSTSTTGTLLVLGEKDTAGDPSGTNGAMYYNSDAGKFRCYENGSWVDCIGGGGSLFTDGGTQTYLTSTTDELVVGGTSSLSAKLAVVGTANQTQLLVRANATQTTPLIVAQNSAGAELFRLSGDGASVYLGRNAGSSVTGGNESTAVGDDALSSLTSGQYNVAFGRRALDAATDTGQNVALGTFTLMGLSTGGGSNTAVGHSAMAFGTAGYNNTAVGAGSLWSTTGNNNTALGGNTLQNLVGGSGNVAIGHSSGANLTSGDNNIIIGPYLNFANTTGSNQLNIAGILTSTNYTNGNLVVGTSDTTAQQLVLDTKTSAGDPTGVNGGMYYNSDAGKFRCYEDGAWVDCIGAAGDLSATLTDNTANAWDIQEGSNNYININTTNGSENISFGNDTVNPSYAFLGTGNLTVGGNVLGSNSATATTGTTTGTGTDTTTLTLTTDAFDVNDVVLIDNAGQDYYTRIVTDPGTGSYTVSPAVTFETGRTVTKYNIQNIGATYNDYSTNANKFFMGQFLGGVSVGAGTTTLSDGLLSTTGTLKIESSNIEITGELKVNENSYFNFGSEGGDSGYGLRDNNGVLEVKDSTGCWYAINGGSCTLTNTPVLASQTTYSPGANGTSTVLTVPTGTADGDLLIAVVSTFNTAVTPPAGWTLIASVNDSGVSVDGVRTSLYYRIASGDTPSSTRSFTHSNNYRSGAMLRITGADTSDPIHAYTSRIRDDDAQIGLPAITTSITNALGIGLIQSYNDTHNSAPPNWTRVTGFDSNWGSINSRSLATATTYATEETAVTEANAYVGLTLAITPADGGTFYGNSDVRLNNLSNVAINTNLLAATTNTVDLGSDTIRFKDLYLSGNATIGGQLNVGTSDTTGTLLVLDTKTNAGDPTGTNGAMYYNSDANKFRCYENGAWADCVASGAILDGGNTEGTDVTIGTNDEFDLNFETNGNTVLSLSTTGAATFQNSTDSTGALQVQNAAGNSLLNVDTTGAGSITLFNNASGEVGSSWTTNSNALPSARGTHATVQHNGYVYVIGGRNSSDTPQSTVYYNSINSDGEIGDGAWTTSGNSLPVSAENLSATVWNGYIYTSVSNDVYYTRINSDGSIGSWVTASNVLGYSPDGHQMIAVNGHLYVIGGWSGAGPTDRVEYARINSDGSLGSFATTSTLPGSRAYFSTGTSNGYIYAVGGLNINGGSSQSSAYYARVNSDGTLGSWSTNGQSLPAGQRTHSGLISNGRYYVFGGNPSTGASTAIYHAPINSDGSIGAWSTAANTLPAARKAHTSIVSNGKIYIFGGEDASGTEQSTVYYTTIGSTLNVGGNIDLVGLLGGTTSSGGNSTNGSQGGSITAGNGTFVGSLQVQGSASFSQNVGILGQLNVAGGISVGTPDATGTLLILDTKTNAGDPTGINGAMYYNSSEGRFKCYENGTWRNCIGGLVYANTTVPGGNTVTGTAADTNFASNYVIPANDCRPGRVYRVTAHGVINSAGSNGIQNKIKLGTTVLGTNLSGGSISATDVGWSADITITCITSGASGTIEAQGNFSYFNTGSGATSVVPISNTSTITIDTTVAQTLQLSADWVSASFDSQTLRQLIVEAL